MKRIRGSIGVDDELIEDVVYLGTHMSTKDTSSFLILTDEEVAHINN
jgi:hypothetical protein